jgi:hypothetical protein
LERLSISMSRRLCFFRRVTGSESISASFPVVVVVVVSVVVVGVEASSSYRSLLVPLVGLAIILDKFETLPPNGVINLLGVEPPELFLEEARLASSGVISPGIIGCETGLGSIGRWGSVGDGLWLAGRERTLKPVFGDVPAVEGTGMGRPRPGGSPFVRRASRSTLSDLGMPMVAVSWEGGRSEGGDSGWLTHSSISAGRDE